MVKALIIEDDPHILQQIEGLVSNNFPNIDVRGSSDSVLGAVSLIVNEEPELLFLDIELKDGLSFEIFEIIKKPNFEVIFITGFDHLAAKTMEHFALSYILKPIDTSKFISSVDHYIRLRERIFSLEKLNLFKTFSEVENKKIMIHTTNEHVLIEVAHIIKCEADGNYTHLYLSDGRKLMASKSLKYYQELFSTDFFRANRSILVNIKYIASIYKKETILLTTKENIHVSTRNKSNLIELLNILS